MQGGSGAILAMIASLKLNKRQRISYFKARKNRAGVKVVFRKISKLSPEEKQKWILKFRHEKEFRNLKDYIALDMTLIFTAFVLYFYFS